MAASAGNIVGLDFGTSTCFAARAHEGLLTLGNEHSHMPSIAGLLGRSLMVGEKALVLPPDKTVRSVKRAITDGRPMVRVGGRFATTEVSRDKIVTAIFKEIRTRVREKGYAFKTSDRLRLGCPAEWTGDQRRLGMQLATDAGLPTGQATMIEEPVAAGMAWLDGQRERAEEIDGRLLVFDMGGGTLDVAVMHARGGPAPEVTVLASAGSTLAGDLLDDTIAEEVCAQHEIDLDALADPIQAWQSLILAASDAKVQLSTDSSHDIFLPGRLFGRTRLPSVRYPRERLEQTFAPQMAEAEQLVIRSLRLARLAHEGGASTAEVMRLSPEELAKDVGYVLLVGGMSRIPLVRRRLRELFPHAELIHHFATSDQVIVAGLASTTGYNTTNMYRPGFDFTLNWNGSGERLYDAHSPLFDPWQVQTGFGQLGYRRRISASSLPRNKRGELVVHTADGKRVDLIHSEVTAFKQGKKVIRGLVIPFGFYDVQFTVYCDGRIKVTDGNNHDHELRIAGWPVIRGSESIHM